MKILFLFLTFCLILTVHAQRPFNQYSCLLTHGEERTPFFLEMNKKHRFTINEREIVAGLFRKDEMVDISIQKKVSFDGTSSVRNQNRVYPAGSRKLLVELPDLRGEAEGHLMLECVPRDP